MFFRKEKVCDKIPYHNIMIVKANLEEAKRLYKNYMEIDFPADELPNYNRFLQLTEKKMHTIYLYQKENQEVAYFITIEKENKVLITHLAVIKEFRSKGIGKVFLEEIKEFFKDKDMLIVEVEAEDRAKNEEELNIIKRRKNYYSRSEFCQVENMEYILYGVIYDILIYTPNKENRYTNAEIKKIMEKIYDSIHLDRNKLKITLI